MENNNKNSTKTFLNLNLIKIMNKESYLIKSVLDAMEDIKNSTETSLFPENILVDTLNKFQSYKNYTEIFIIANQTRKMSHLHKNMNKLSIKPMSAYKLKHFYGFRKLSKLKMQEQAEYLVDLYHNTDYILRKDIESLIKAIDDVINTFDTVLKVIENPQFHEKIKSSIERLKDSSNYYITYKKNLKDILKLYNDILNDWVEHEVTIIKYMIKNPKAVVVKSGPLKFISPQEAMIPIEPDYIVDINSLTSADKEKYYRFENSIKRKVHELEKKIISLTDDISEYHMN